VPASVSLWKNVISFNSTSDFTNTPMTRPLQFLLFVGLKIEEKKKEKNINIGIIGDKLRYMSQTRTLEKLSGRG
jgi:hypothetical protein